MTNILIFVDSKWRDSKSMVSLSKKLTNMGHNTILTSFDNWQEAIRLNPNIVVLNHLIGKRNKDIANYIKSYDGKVVILPTEGRPNNDMIEKWFYFAGSGKYDLWLDWNDAYKSKYTDDGRHVITGCPRFDVYPNKQHKTRSETLGLFGIDATKKVGLIASSFPQAKFAYTHGQFNKIDWNDLERGDADENVRSELREFKLFFNTMKLAVQLREDWEFIIRPHPMEASWMWEHFCEENDNCTMITQLPIEDLVASCDLLINRAGCITFYDGILAGLKNIVTLNLDKRELTGAELEAYNSSKRFSDAGNFISFMGHIPEHNQLNTGFGQIIENHLHNVGLATSLVAEAISGLDVTETERNSQSIIEFQLKRKLSNQANAYPSVDSLHTGKIATDGSLTGLWQSEYRNESK